jgi:hypothetical protein
MNAKETAEIMDAFFKDKAPDMVVHSRTIPDDVVQEQMCQDMEKFAKEASHFNEPIFVGRAITFREKLRSSGFAKFSFHSLGSIWRCSKGRRYAAITEYMAAVMRGLTPLIFWLEKK